MDQPTQPQIKGSAIRDARDWVRRSLGDETFTKAKAAAGADGEFLSHPILATSWYPVAAWDRFLAVARAEYRTRHGATDHDFNMANMRSAGSAVVRTLFKFMLGLLSAKSVLEKIPGLYSRFYNEGRCELVVNEPGRAVLRYSGCDPVYRQNLINNFGPGTVFLLELNGVKNIVAQISRDELVDGKLLYELTVTYDGT